VLFRSIDKFDVILIDESHRSPSNTWIDLLSSAEHIEYVYNFTATPFRADGMDMAIHAFGGPIVYEKDLIYGIKNGFLMPFDLYKADLYAKAPSGNAIALNDKTINTSAYKKLISNDYVIDQLAALVHKAHASGRRVIIMFKTLAPAKLLAKKCKAKIGFAVADANFKKPLKDFKEGKVSVLAATSKLVGEGIDIPDADMLILVTQHSSDVMTYQALGRVLRLSPDKKKPIIVDVVMKGYSQFEGAYQKRAKVWRKAADKINEMKIT
jgi:superfamily II DNA or RNA helicase